MHFVLEAVTVFFFGLCAVHALRVHGSLGMRLMIAMTALGFVRETFVVLRKILYGYAELNLMVGAAPLISAVIWGYSIYLAVCWAESVTGQALEQYLRSPGALWLGAVAVFMICLVGFYEPFLERVGMARWEAGTLKTAGVPWIALVGYPTLSVPFLWIWGRLERVASKSRRLVAQLSAASVLGIAHAVLLSGLKGWLGW